MKPSTSRNNFFYLLGFNFLSNNFQISLCFAHVFPKFSNSPRFARVFPKFSNSLCFPCLELLFTIFPVFRVEWEPWNKFYKVSMRARTSSEKALKKRLFRCYYPFHNQWNAHPPALKWFAFVAHGRYNKWTRKLQHVCVAI